MGTKQVENMSRCCRCGRFVGLKGGGLYPYTKHKCPKPYMKPTIKDFIDILKKWKEDEQMQKMW